MIIGPKNLRSNYFGEEKNHCEHSHNSQKIQHQILVYNVKDKKFAILSENKLIVVIRI